MITQCQSCGEELEVPEGTADGQHILCPYCNCKFTYRMKRIASKPPAMRDNASRRVVNVSRNKMRGVGTFDADTVSSNDKSGVIRNIIVVSVLAAAFVFGLAQYRKFELRQAYEAQLRTERERAESERAALERAAEIERERKEAEEREQRIRREREAEDARLEQERLENRRKEREEREAKRREIEKLSAAQENYRRARDSFGLMTAHFYFDVLKDGSSANPTGVVWYVDESFGRDGRIYEIKNGVDAWVLYPDKLPERASGGFAVTSPESKAGFLVMNGRVLICGTFRNTRRCSVPNRGKAFVPYEVDLDKLLDIALLLGINAPEKDYHVILQKKNGECVRDFGICRADDVVSWDSIEESARNVLERRLKRSAKTIKPPVPKKMRRTVVFYDGGISKKDIRGVIHIPRTFQYRYYGSIDYRANERAREEWERMRDIAMREDEEEKKIANENSLARQEFEQKAKAMNMKVVEESAIDKFLGDCELLVEKDARGRKKGMLKNAGNKSISSKAMTKKDPITDSKSTSPKSVTKKDPVKCYKCKGQGMIKSSVLEQCDMCLGEGAVTHEIELSNSHYVGDNWNTKKSKAGYDCPKCKKRGKVRIEKDVECPVCRGRGTL